MLRCGIVTSMLFVFGLLAAGSGWGAERGDLDAAFLASFGQPAPAVRTVWQPRYVYDLDGPPKRDGRERFVFDVRPGRLVPLGGGRYALVSFETQRMAGHSEVGRVAVSYLRRTAAGWRLRGSWPELMTSGEFGKPANAGAEVHRFGGAPLFAARSEWCGMDECSETIGVIRLGRRRPVAYEDVLAGAEKPMEGDPSTGYPDGNCRNYDVRARIEAARRRGALFGVRYDGWTAPPGRLWPRKELHLFTSYVPRGRTLAMRPVVPVPDCGR